MSTVAMSPTSVPAFAAKSAHRDQRQPLHRVAVTVAAAVILAGAAGYYWHQSGGEAKRAAGARPSPVSVAAAVRQDVPIYASGLGTVQALNTVPIRFHRDPAGVFTWVIEADGKAQMRPIHMGPPTEEVTIVTAGLDVGEQVVTEGFYRLEPGYLVVIQQPTERSAAVSRGQGRAQ
jgi:multidrug efflux pump subunit AcrA (membrane-fusion protein)